MKEKIFLRRFQLSDAPVLLKWGKDERYHKLAGFERINNLEEAKYAAQQYVKRTNSFAICLNDKSNVIGLIEMYERGMDERSGLLQTKEIGFLMAKEYEGHGYMKRAIQLVLKEAFIKQKQTEIWAGTFEDNTRSQKLLENLGFKYKYSIDYSQIYNLFSYKEKYYLLKKAEWLKINENTKS